MYDDRANTRANINVKIRTRKKGGFSTHLTSPRLISSLGTGAGTGAGAGAPRRSVRPASVWLCCVYTSWYFGLAAVH